MSIGYYSHYSNISIIDLQSIAPARTQFVGENPLPVLSEITIAAFVKPRFAHPNEKRTSSSDLGTSGPKFGFFYAPWRIFLGEPTYQSPTVAAFFNVTFNMETASFQNTSASIVVDAQQQIRDDDGGTFTTDARVNENVVANNVPSDEKWYFLAQTSALPSGVTTFYIIDPDDGSLLYTGTDTDVQNENASPFVGQVPANGDDTLIRAFGDAVSSSTIVNTDYDSKVAEIGVWHRNLTLSQLQAVAQVGFFAINEPSDLVLDWNFMLNWGATNTAVIPDQSGNGNHGDILDVNSRTQFFTDNPVPVFIPQILLNEHDFIRLDLFSGSAGTIYAGVYPRAASEPIASAVASGSGALSTGSVVGDGTNSVVLDVDQPDTDTPYTIYFAQDTTGSGDFSEVYSLEYSSPFKYSETIVDIDGADLVDVLGIEYSWFDSVDVDNLGTVKASGSAEATDRDALLEITLPRSINTSKGQSGIMVLKVIDNETTRTATHIAEVK